MQPTSSNYLPRQLAQSQPQRLAFKMCGSGESVSFADLEARANQGAHLLRASGVQTGDHILILMENRREFLETCFAADRCGVYYTSASTHLNFDELSSIVSDCGAKLAVVSDTFTSIAERLIQSPAHELMLFMVGDTLAGARSWTAELKRQASWPIADESQGLDMLYSSGTTGRPKGIKWPLSGQALGAPTMLVSLLTELFGYDEHTRYLCPAPLYHAAPLRHTMVTIKAGGSACVMERFDAHSALALIEQERITHSQWVPTMFVRMLKLPSTIRRQYDLSSMRLAVHAAAPCPVETKRAMLAWWGPIIHEYYAGTENNGFVSITPQEWLAHPGSVGRAKLGVLHISDASGRDFGTGEEGEVYFESGHQFAYHNDPIKTAHATNARGWTTLGDVGRVDEEGYLYLTDRKSFMIISGGVNVYPQETENILLGHPAVLDAAVIGVPNEDWGEEVKAVVQLASGAHPSPALAQTLMTYCRERLSAIKCPKSIDFTEALPRTETGKLLKRKLRDEYWPAR
jgi:long-chain acyl-CoA synthetase